MAGREIKTTLIVDGEAAFKREINDAKQSVRNLGTQLTLAAAEFKKDGDAMKLMQSRAKALKDEISAQQKIVKALEGAVKDAAKKYGEGSKEAEKWEAELNRAKAAMASLETELNNNERGLDRNGKAFDDAKAKAGEFSNAVNNISRGVSFEMITSGIDKISSGFDRAVSKATQLATKMWDMMRDAAGWADDEITLAKVYGVSTEDLQRMQYAAKFTDTNVDIIIRSRQKLERAMKSSSKEDIEAFQTVRVPRVDENGKLRDVDDMFWSIGGSLSRMTNEVERDNAAMKLFGRSWMELRPLFEVGRAGYEGLLAKATVVPDENLNKLGTLQDQLDEMDSQIQTFKMSVLGDLAPSFQTIAESISGLMEQFNEYLQSEEGKAMMEEFNAALTELFSGLKDVDFQSAVNTVKTALGGVKDALKWISENGIGVADALKAIGIAIVGMKMGEFALNLTKTVAGFKWLLGRGGGGQAAQQGAEEAAPASTATARVLPAWMTKAAANASSLLTTYDPTGLSAAIPMAIGDLTAFGQTLRDGGDLGDALQASESAIMQWTVDTVQRGMNFVEDWKNNALWQWFSGLFSGGGEDPGWEANNEQIARQFADDMLQNTVSIIGEKLAYNLNRGGRSILDSAKSTGDAVNPVSGGGEDPGWEANNEWIARQFADDMLQNTFSIIGEKLAYDLKRGVSGILDSAPSTGAVVNPVVYSEPSQPGGGTGDKNTAEIAMLRNLPTETGNAVRKSVNGMAVKMDGRTVGYLVAPYVSEAIGRDIG